jgi:hypothetical protein
MALVVNNPNASQADTSWVGMVIGILVVGFLLLLFFFYGLPFLRGSMSGNNGSDINVSLPDKVDVNTNQPVQPAQP